MISRSPRRRSGFTLMELLVVVAIVVIVSAAAIPVVRPALSQRKVSSAALLVQSELARCRDAAIRANAPRGIRLLPSLDDRFKFVPYPPGTSPTAAQLAAYNNSTPAYTRMLSIEPAPDYSAGLVTVKPVGVSNGASDLDSLGMAKGGYLRVQECVAYYIPGVVNASGNPLPLPNERVNWYWNVRVGDKFRFHDSGNVYTVVGPITLSDPTVNPELYVNNDASTAGDYTGVQFLYLVNGVDDNGDGYIDSSFDNVDNNGDGTIDPVPYWGYSIGTAAAMILQESEPEQFQGFPTFTLAPYPNMIDEDGDGLDSPSDPLDPMTFSQLAYTIQRRPIPSAGSRILELPSGTAIDMTGWMRNGAELGERSRLPIDPRTGFIDILIAPNGQVLKADYNTTQPGAPLNFPYFHFWITDTDDIVEPSSTAASLSTALPTPDTPDATGRLLKGERRLVSINTRTGQIVTGSAENFSTSNINTPYFNVEHGIRDEQ